ncbi:MAG TPA: hypothetical protein VJQ42_06965 [Rhodanobacteraceae bacterium]|nr:hypothetical protein [Rhodanobacteraceae bacterium]
MSVRDRRNVSATSTGGKSDSAMSSRRYTPNPSSVGPRRTRTPVRGSWAKMRVQFGSHCNASARSRPTLPAWMSNAQATSTSRTW